MKLLRPFTGTGAIFFPVGKPPKGTCQFATDACLRECYAIQDNYWEEECRIPETEKRHIYQEITLTPVLGLKRVIDRMLNELDGLQTEILHWFGTGDCLPKDIDQVSRIIDIMPTAITQMGFTRNEKLWERYKDIFVLTIEDEDEMQGREGRFSLTDYNEQVSIIRASGFRVRGGHCGPATCRDIRDDRLEHYINCKTCLRMKAGCFDRGEDRSR